MVPQLDLFWDLILMKLECYAKLYKVYSFI